MIITLVAAKGSPGVTTLALALGSVWPADRPVVLADLDADGGDMACWLQRPAEPGLLTLAADGLVDTDVAGHLQGLDASGSLRALLGPADAAQAAAALRSLPGSALPEALEAHGDVLIDGGRFPRLPSAVTEASDLVLVVAVASVPGLAHAHAAAKRLARSKAALVLAAPRSAPLGASLRELQVGRREAESVVGLPVLADLPDDPVVACALGGLTPAPRRIERSPLYRSVAALAGALQTMSLQETPA